MTQNLLYQKYKSISKKELVPFWRKVTPIVVSFFYPGLESCEIIPILEQVNFCIPISWSVFLRATALAIGASDVVVVESNSTIMTDLFLFTRTLVSGCHSVPYRCCYVISSEYHCLLHFPRRKSCILYAGSSSRLSGRFF